MGSGYVATCDDDGPCLSAREQRTLRLHNQERAERGLGQELCAHPALARAARPLAGDESAKITAHTTSTTARALAPASGAWLRSAQHLRREHRLGSGSLGSPDSVFESWMNSSGHRANILDNRYREIGIGAVTGTYKSYSNATMWTADFGAR